MYLRTYKGFISLRGLTHQDVIWPRKVLICMISLDKFTQVSKSEPCQPVTLQLSLVCLVSTGKNVIDTSGKTLRDNLQ